MRLELLQAYYLSDEYREKLLKRVSVLKDAEQDSTRLMQLAVDVWAANPIEFIEQFAWIINPKFNNEVKPMFLFEYQKDIIRKIWESELSGQEHEILIDKPREMGLTWIFVWYFIWRWLFTQNWSGFVLSRSESEVDDGTIDPSKSIFGKIRWALGCLPEWLLPNGYQAKGKKGTSTDMMMRITNPQMTSTIVGSTANENAGRGGRFSLSWVDECFFIEHFMAVHRSLAHVANTRCYVSTSKTGRSYQKFVDLVDERGDHIQLKYSDNPFKDQVWYDKKVEEAAIDPEAMKEIEVSYAVSTAFQYYPEIVNATIESVNYVHGIPLYISLDYGRQDHTVLIWWQYVSGYFHILECVAKNKVDFDWFYPFLNNEISYDSNRFLGHYEATLKRVRNWSRPNAAFGEPAHKQIHYPSRESIQMKLAREAKVNLIVNDQAIQYEVRRKASSLILPRCKFNKDSNGVMELFDAIQNSRYAGSSKGMSKESQMKPAHDDENGDYRSAFENFAVNTPKIIRRIGGSGSVDESIFTQALMRMLK